MAERVDDDDVVTAGLRVVADAAAPLAMIVALDQPQARTRPGVDRQEGVARASDRVDRGVERDGGRPLEALRRPLGAEPPFAADLGRARLGAARSVHLARLTALELAPQVGDGDGDRHAPPERPVRRGRPNAVSISDVVTTSARRMAVAITAMTTATQDVRAVGDGEPERRLERCRRSAPRPLPRGIRRDDDPRDCVDVGREPHGDARDEQEDPHRDLCLQDPPQARLHVPHVVGERRRAERAPEDALLCRVATRRGGRALPAARQPVAQPRVGRFGARARPRAYAPWRAARRSSDRGPRSCRRRALAGPRPPGRRPCQSA